MELLVLLIVANGAPVLASLVLREKLAWPLDFGYSFSDGRRILGSSKTLRGLTVALVATGLAALLLGLPVFLGLLIGLGAMAGDALSSFIKRRLGVPPHGDLPGIDQVPESLLPLLLVKPWLQVDNLNLLGVILAFVVAELGLSSLLARIQRPKD